MRRAHRLRPNRKTELPTLLIVVDTETDSIPISDKSVEARLRFGWIASSRRHRGTHWTPLEWCRFDTPADAWDHILSLIPDGWTGRLVAHNAGFDMRVINMWRELPARNWTSKGAVIEDPPTIVKWRQGRKGLVVLDSLNWYRVPLREVGEKMGIPKLEHDLKWSNSERDDAYCKRDCEIVMAAMQYQINQVADLDLGNFASTLPSQAFTAWKHRHLGVPVLIDDHPKALALARSAYHGGRTEPWQLGVIHDTVTVFDVVSMYPAMMLVTPMPTVLRGYYNRVTIDDLSHLMETYAVVADVSISTESADYPLVHNDRLIFPVGSFRSTLCTPELTHALRAGHVTAAHSVAVYDRELIFTSFIAEWHTRRQQAIAAGDAAFSWFCKRMMNALYGKFGQSGDVWEDVGAADPTDVHVWLEWDVDTQSVVHFRSFGGVLQKRAGEIEARESHPAIAAHVTSAARMRLLALLNRAGRENVIYMDTDSVFTLPAGTDRLTQFVNPTRLGSLKLEATYDDLTIFGAKDYLAGGKRKIKGIRSNAIEIEPGKWQQDTFEGLKGALLTGNLHRQVITQTVKRLSRLYSKGTVDGTGRIHPYRVTL